MVPGLGLKVVGHPAARVSRHIGTKGVADLGQGSMSFSRRVSPHGPLPQARSGTSLPTRRDTHSGTVSPAARNNQTVITSTLIYLRQPLTSGTST